MDGAPLDARFGEDAGDAVRAVLGARENQHRAFGAFAQQADEQVFFSAFSANMTLWLIVSTTDAGGVTVTCTGSWSIELASVTMSEGIVAERRASAALWAAAEVSV